MDFTRYYEQIFQIKSKVQFSKLAEQAFEYQSDAVPVYRDFLSHLRPEHLVDLKADKIPALPIEFFRTHLVHDGLWTEESGLCFRSSGTTDSVRSCHYVARPAVYERSFLTTFKRIYGEPANWAVLALLPSYMERPDSSLLYMVAELVRSSEAPQSGFYPESGTAFIQALQDAMDSNRQVMVIGVTFALLDWAESNPLQLRNTLLMETGGMKGRREELVRPALHEHLKRAFNLPAVHSEYGMTELLSQAYARRDGKFVSPPWMRIYVTDPLDPFRTLPFGQLGQLRVIDLANIHSCCFLQTRDLGRQFPDGSFTVEGRLDHSDIRGCNLLMSL